MYLIFTEDDGWHTYQLVDAFNKNKKDNFKHRNFKITTQLASILNLNLRILINMELQ